MAAIVVGGVAYGKPNMAALEGDLGRRILDAIRTAPKPDDDALRAESERISARIREAKANGTF